MSGWVVGWDKMGWLSPARVRYGAPCDANKEANKGQQAALLCLYVLSEQKVIRVGPFFVLQLDSRHHKALFLSVAKHAV